MFAGVPDAELEPLVRAGRRFEVRAGQPLWLQGDRAEELYVIGEGHLKSYRIGADGQQIVMWFFGPGETTGEPALFLPAATRGTSVEAAERTSGVAIPRAALLDFLDTHPVANRRLLQRLSEMLWDSHTMPSEVAFQNIPGRVARKLLDLAAVHGVDDNGSTRIGVRLSQGTLAAMVAASRENVNRALAPLLSSKIVSHDGGYFTILDVARLRQRASGLD
jgi:CRP/FNR family cyclic AMP-dependent transcriptional regulator